MRPSHGSESLGSSAIGVPPEFPERTPGESGVKRACGENHSAGDACRVPTTGASATASWRVALMVVSSHRPHVWAGVAGGRPRRRATISRLASQMNSKLVVR
jgi:hypothetical protein